MEHIRKKIVNILYREGNIEGDIPEQEDIYNDLKIESVNSINILLALEDQFEIAIDDKDFINARTLFSLNTLVERLIA